MAAAINSIQAVAVIGAQFGDEGKGAIVDRLISRATESPTTTTVVCARFAGGSNAGHTVKVDGDVFKFHLLPSGILHDNCNNVIGSGCVVDIECLVQELTAIEKRNITLQISEDAHLVFRRHK
jgi:adenylosuccinate synthase